MRNSKWRLVVPATIVFLAPLRVGAASPAFHVPFVVGLTTVRAVSAPLGGYGASQPQDRNDTPEGRARNRRVELTRQ